MSSALGTRPAVAGSESDASRPSRRGRGPLARATLAFASDERLAKRAAAGDPDAFATIFRRYGQDLYRFCVGILREPQDAEDAVQNTMMRALRALPGETRDMQLRPWLYRIAHNEAVELRRRRRPAEPLGPTIDIGAGTEDLVEQDARLRTLLADIADLPERQRASLVMRELNGLDFGEIGTALETSPGAARQALYEARRGLSQMEQGRDMDCEKAMRQVSDEDGSPRRRGVRAHLRDCARCRHFQAEIRERKEALAAISPLPLVLVAALAKSSLGGSVGGAAAGAGIGAASAVGVGGGGAGAAAGSVGASTLVKGAAGLLAALALGAGAADHGGLVSFGGHQSDHAGGASADVRGVEATAAGRGVAGRSGAGAGTRPQGADTRHRPAAIDRGDEFVPRRRAAPGLARAVAKGGDGARRLAAHAGGSPSTTSVSELGTSGGKAGDGRGVPTEPEGAGNGKGAEKSQGKGAENSQGNGSEGGNRNGNGAKQGNGNGVENSQGKASARSEGKGSAHSQGKGSEKSRGGGAGKPAGKGAGESEAGRSENSQGNGAEKSEAEHLPHRGQSTQEVAATPAPEAEATAPTAIPAETGGEGGGNGKAKKEAESASE